MPLLGRHNNAAAAGTGATEYDTRTGHTAGHTTGGHMANQAPMGTGTHAVGNASGPTGHMNATTHQAPMGRHHQGTVAGDPYANTIQNNEVTPVENFSNGQKSGSGNATLGKMEHALGTLVGSSSLKAKGLQKEQQAQAHKAQSAEISEAERLEHEAALRRERAADFGAHASNQPVAGHGHNAAQAQEYGGNFGTMGAPGGPMGGNSAVPGGRATAL